MSSSHHHSRVESNNVDPDDGRSWLCSACNLPIFATPFVRDGATPSVLLLHDECSDLPEELEHCVLHREKPMFLVDNELQSATCSQCSQKCGSKMYHCPDPDCGLILDVACALPIKILHWSHPHRLLPIRGCNLSICGICGATHESTSMTTSYLCSACGFWIHPECAALARVIEHEKHEHPLVLYNDIQATFGAEDSTRPTLDDLTFSIRERSIRRLKDERCLCAICWNEVARRCGVYSCIMCRDYVIHVKCATSQPQSFKSVPIGEARFPNLVHLPMKNEHQSFVCYTMHMLTSNGLPTLLSTIPAHTPHHIFKCFLWAHESFICSHCRCEYIGAFYRCFQDTFQLDVSCALMTGFITHDVHNAAHIMRLTSSSSNRDRVVCDCCCRPLGNLFYECRTCPNFALHTWCAMLPKTVAHKFDKHPLILTTTSTASTAAAEKMMMICEICENGMVSDEAWYYSCSECDQSFHVDCIPRLDLMNKFKSVADSNPRVRLPKRLIRGLTLQGHGHDYCADVADEYDILLPYS